LVLQTKLYLSWSDILYYITASELLVNREQKRRSKYNTESELDTIEVDRDTSDRDSIINNNRSEDSEESQLEMANIHLMKEEPIVVEKLRKNSSEHLLPGTFCYVCQEIVESLFRCVIIGVIYLCIYYDVHTSLFMRIIHLMLTYAFFLSQTHILLHTFT